MLKQTLTVSQLTSDIKNLLEDEFRFVQVSGEISNLRRPYSGHSYFTLKDDRAQLTSVLFKNQQRFLLEDLRDGQQVICHGRISVYEPRGNYQLIVDTIDFHGSGLLQLRFEALKKRLEAEGLFAADHKKQIPALPKRITLITSATGAAVHDFLSIWHKRQSTIDIDIYPVRVQGPDAAEEISSAIDHLGRLRHCDIIVLCRGGGSLEDLWAFNEEIMAWSIYHSQIPVVSAVGHEIDFTIADFCADLRTPTPTGAAERLIPDVRQLKLIIQDRRRRLASRITEQLIRSEQDLRQNKKLLGKLETRFTRHTLETDHLTDRLIRGIRHKLNHEHQTLVHTEQRLQHQLPSRRVTMHQERMKSITARFNTQLERILEQKTAALAHQASLLDAVSPLSILGRGYSIARRKKKGRAKEEIISRSTQVKPQDQLEILLNQGIIECEVIDTSTVKIDQKGPWKNQGQR
ncbi:MAG: exodeoxyribonuclease VII large subunit [Desulfobulbaceae bacterium]|uniref:Exodeoxyribonuclease 7 large subunit n=1 Tax=Candidatus Desulfatifera sulfidica TaxID=2841691 RepID=A0A8J6NA23_9BACT|nr:exodeoxyribonuclease VII large subunit [Candidatus Desulfatifera sulfidica]